MLWKIYQRLEYLNHLIQTRSTGSPKELAKKLGITERAWYLFRDELVNDLKVPIKYCKHSNSYIYTEEGRLEMGFKKLSEASQLQILGRGNCIIYPVYL